MKTTKLLFFLVLLVFIQLSYSCVNVKSKTNNASINPLIGSWEVKSIYFITKDTTYSIENAQPGLLIINPERYSIMWTPTPNARTPFKNL